MLGAFYVRNLGPIKPMISHLNTVYPSTERFGIRLSDFECLHTFQSTVRCGESEETVLVTFISWLSEQLESLPPSHPLRLVVLDHSSTCAKDPQDWRRLDELICARKTLRVSLNLASEDEHVTCRRILSSGFQGSDQAGLLTFTYDVS